MYIKSLNNKDYSSAVSPVIGAVLLIGLTIGLFSFVSVMMFEQINDGRYDITNSNVEITDYGEIRVTDKGDADNIMVHESSGDTYELSMGEIYKPQDSDFSIVSISDNEEHLIRNQNDETRTEEMSGSGTEYDPFIIMNEFQLQSINENPDAYYEIGQDIDASITDDWDDGNGFEPIENFDGELDGNNYTISNLYIDREDEDTVGLIRTLGGVIKDVRATNININGNNLVGGLIGENDSRLEINNLFVEGTVSGEEKVGGIVGRNNNHASITTSESNINVLGTKDVGGLVGYNKNQAEIENSFVTGIVDGDINVGGLLGHNRQTADVENTYFVGSVTGIENVGGLVGWNRNNAVIKQSFVGGPENHSGSTINGQTNVGGLVGENDNQGDILNSYWDINKTGITEENNSGGPPGQNSGIGNGLETEEMQGNNAKENMSDFDFQNVWLIIEDNYPELRDELFL